MIFRRVRRYFLTFYPGILLSWLFAFENPVLAEDTIPCPVIISEIMADPYPQVALPGVEYIEIFNRSAYVLDISGWKLRIGNHEKILPAASIMPGEYRILCDADADSMLNVYGKLLLIPNMPAILNSGQVITLKTSSGEVIHSVEFSQSWYNKDKSDGGWSIEIIDPDNPCGRKENWRESTDPQGGTPGKLNSVFALNRDHQSPLFLRATLPSDASVLLHFSEPMNARTLNSLRNYSVSDGLFHPISVYPVEPSFTTALLNFPGTFMRDHIYTITLLEAPEDCAGNPLSANAFADFAIAEKPGAFDVVFNEILFNAAENTSEFIELFNRSDKVVDLSAFCLALADPVTDTVKKMISFSTLPFILFPGDYLVVTADAARLPGTALRTDLRFAVEHPGMFALADDGALIFLLDSNGQVIDKLLYSPNMHEAILSETKGISLERADPENLDYDGENWHSASTTSGYCTPGHKNSQFTHNTDALLLTVNPEVFSPDSDGLDDLTTLHMQFQQPGWTGSVSIYDTRGKCIKTLLTNSLLGTDEYFQWDGRQADDEPANIGIYIFYVEVFNQQGVCKKFKKVISLVRKYTR